MIRRPAAVLISSRSIGSITSTARFTSTSRRKKRCRNGGRPPESPVQRMAAPPEARPGLTFPPHPPLARAMKCSGEDGHANQKARQELHGGTRRRLQLADLARRHCSHVAMVADHGPPGFSNRRRVLLTRAY